MIESGEYPRWFEFGTEGPERIGSPGEASLRPLTPWPLARFITGFISQEDRVVGVVNRSGFLVILPGGEAGRALYRVEDVPYWEGYTAEAPFLYRGMPAALLYRNDFFADPAPEPPAPPVWTLIKGVSRPVGLELPLFGTLPAEGWDLEALRQGRDGRWYYRGLRRQGNRTAYFRGPDLSAPGPGEASSVGAFRDAAVPHSPQDAPPALTALLEAAFRLSDPAHIRVAALSSPEFAGIRRFSADIPAGAGSREEESGGGEAFIEFFGYYDPPGGSSDPKEAVVPFGAVFLPGGAGVYGRLREGGWEIGTVSLPPLPEQFVYTGIGCSGGVLIVSWEEREDWNVGAAGFMVVDAPW